MKHVIVVFDDIPEGMRDPTGNMSAQQAFDGVLAPTEPKRKRLARNVWLVDFRTNPDALAALLHLSAQRSLHYAIFPVDDQETWSGENAEKYKSE